MAVELCQVAYTDGACLKNPGGAGGWAYIVVDGDAELAAGKGGDPATTNNRMEMQAAIEALRATTGGVLLWSDSVYLVKGYTMWLAGWKRRGWVTAARQPVKNRDLWEQIDALSSGRHVRLRWVRGHDGNRHNERVDEMADDAARAVLLGVGRG